MEFRCIDRPSAAQVVTVKYERILKRDETADAPDDRDDGFWPSTDTNAAGYVLPEKFVEEQVKAQERFAAWRADEWHYVGVIARAHVSVPIGGNSFAMYELDSPGCWGVESDAGEYLDVVYADELDTLKEHMRVMGAAFTAQLSTDAPLGLRPPRGFEFMEGERDLRPGEYLIRNTRTGIACAWAPGGALRVIGAAS